MLTRVLVHNVLHCALRTVLDAVLRAAGAIWDMNVEGSQWGAFAANHPEQLQAVVKALSVQLPNFIASVPEAFRNDSACIAGGTSSSSWVPYCVHNLCDFPICDPAELSNVSKADAQCLTQSDHGSNNNFDEYYGGLPWMMHFAFLSYRHSMDESILRALEPILRRALTLYIRTATALGPSTDGMLHLPQMFSPEYGFASGNKKKKRKRALGNHI